MSNFAFLPTEFRAIQEFATNEESQKRDYLRVACFKFAALVQACYEKSELHR
ncbi:MAG: hypothetical protein K9L82_12105 [Chromatiaceae bacterium]|nr:hypothetical protein [Chromatiaceae bacterium]MCF8015614.1 hypothetical protein [Chromatiaceae bacterium]